MTALPKRKHRSMRVERDAALHKLGLLGVKVEWNHTPPLGLREQVKDESGNVIGYMPDENDPRYLEPVAAEDHAAITNGKPHVKVDGDKSKIAKAKRLAKGQELLREILADRQAEREARKAKTAKSKWPSRKFNLRRKP